MQKPSTVQVFDLLYGHAAANGREEALFGNRGEQLRQTAKKMMYGDHHPTLYLEFPLIGEPYCDLNAVFSRPEKAVFAPGAGFGYQSVFDWFATSVEEKRINMGMNVDLGSGDSDHAGIYLSFGKSTDLIEPFLRNIGEESRTVLFLDAINRMPEELNVNYIALFPARKGSPSRIAGLFQKEAKEAISKNPSLLGEYLTQAGFTAYNETMLEQCASYMSYVPAAEFQFEMLPDGSLGDSFGLCLFPDRNPTRPLDWDYVRTGPAADLAKQLEKDGLADSRWKLAAEALYATGIPMKDEDGSEWIYAFVLGYNCYKVKYKNAEVQPAKCYLSLTSFETKRM